MQARILCAAMGVFLASCERNVSRQTAPPTGDIGADKTDEHGACSAAEHFCDGLDEDCDGKIDEISAANIPNDDVRILTICRNCDDVHSRNCVKQCERTAVEGGVREDCVKWCGREDALLNCREWWTTACDDNDGDGYYAAECDNQPPDANYTDCNDSHVSVYPAPAEQLEVCDGIDNNCDYEVDSGPCVGECGQGMLVCGLDLIPNCSTSPGGAEYLPERSLCSTCRSPLPNGTIGSEESCERHEACDETGSSLIRSLITERLREDAPWLSEIEWAFCPGIEYCCNGLDDDADGETDEADDCGNAPFCEYIEYIIFEEWCAGIDMTDSRERAIADLLASAEECIITAETDPVFMFILEHLDNQPICSRTLFKELKNIAGGIYSWRSMCGYADGVFVPEPITGLGFEPDWLAAVMENPCASPEERELFTRFIIAVLSHTSRESGRITEDISPEEACIYGDIDFASCPVPEQRNVCLGSFCMDLENRPNAAGIVCTGSGRNIQPWRWPIDRCDRLFGGGPGFSEVPPEAEFCEYGCGNDTDECRPCAFGMFSGRGPSCRYYAPNGSFSSSFCGADNCGNSCGECDYNERCGWIRTDRFCEEAPLACNDWTIYDVGDWNPGTATTTLSPISTDTDEICLGELPRNRYIGAIDGIPGWSPNTCYDLRAYDREAIVADGEIVVTVGCSALPCHRMEEWDFVLRLCRYIN